MTKSPNCRAWAAAVMASVMITALVPSSAHAAEPARVLIVRERLKKEDPLLAEAYLRVASELRSIGFDVRERTSRSSGGGQGDSPRADVESDDDAVATILVRRVGSGTTTDVWLADHLTRKTVLRKIDAHDDPATLAMLVLELMRASLIEPFAAPSQIAPPPPPPKEVTHFVEQQPPPPALAPHPKRITLDVGASVLWGDVGLAIAPTVSIAYRITGPVKIGLVGMAPAFGAVVRGEQGVAHVRQELALMELAWHPLSFSKWIHPRAAIGLGVYHLAAEGDARVAIWHTRDGVWAFVTSASAGGSLALTRTVRIALDARLLLGFPRPVVRFASQEVASALRPSAAFTAALEVDL